ncbi:NUDIX domain-containing protein [Bacteroidales bacterium OttesenSCG-928-I21]|nr:NUDIX domain-containing protein [Bacteroidales bacterium OttesenSCG-928-I21]
MTKYSFHHTFKFCPCCASKEFSFNNEKSKQCAACGFVYYFNASAAVAAFIVNDKSELLVCKRAKDPAKGTFDLPGGFVDSEETAEQAITREIKEELSVDVQSLSYVFSLPNTYRYSDLDIPTLDCFFEAKIDDFSSLKAADDVEEFYFIPKKNLNPEEFGLKSIRKAVKIWMEQ